MASLLQEAVRLHQGGRLSAAGALYRQVLEQAPRQFDALHLLGVIARQEGRAGEAAALISDALTLDPAHAGAHCNLGAALQDLGRTGDALASYDRAVALDPAYALAFSNRGNTLRKLGRLEQALASYERALALRPAYPEAACYRAMLLLDLGRPQEALSGADAALAARPRYVEAWTARGNALQALERFGEAVESYDRALAIDGSSAETWCARGAALKRMQEFDAALGSYERAIALRPGYATAHHYRANALRALGRADEAIEAYRRALALGADAVQVGFALAALGAGEAPAASPQEYVKELFDQYAGHFDQHLVEVLDYRTPALLAGAIRTAAAPEHADTIDLGCGTGLMAPLLRPFSRTLAGVDLSHKMLEKAHARALYDKLDCGDIVQYLAQHRGAFDLAVAADVLVYFGDLGPVFAQARDALRPGGWFCFSVEACEQGDYLLQPSNRYAHSPDYVRRIAAATGFTVVQSVPAQLRSENGAPVTGHLVVLRAPEAAGV